MFYSGIPIVRSRITKLVEQHGYATVFVLASVLESGGGGAISALASEIYAVSLNWFPDVVYFVFSTFGFLCILLLVLVKSSFRTSDRNFSLLGSCSSWSLVQRSKKTL